jgi:hypothetical protein
MTRPSSERKPLIELEQECEDARNRNLIDEYLYNPFLTRPYILIRFHKTTAFAQKLEIREYIKRHYTVESAEFVSEGNALYVVYGFWDR